MADTDFSLTTHFMADGLVTLAFSGELTSQAEAEVMAALEQLSAAGARRILLGFDDMTYMNSAGIGLLVRMVVRAQRQDQQILAYGLREHFRRIFELTRLNEVIRLCETADEARALALASAAPQ